MHVCLNIYKHSYEIFCAISHKNMGERQREKKETKTESWKQCKRHSNRSFILFAVLYRIVIFLLFS